MRDIDEIVSGAEAVPGWTEGEDARAVALASYALPDDATIVEVGVYMGRSTVLLAGARRLRGSGIVHCVDPFDCSGDAFSVPHYLEGLRATGLDSLEVAFRRQIASSGLDRWIEVHRGTALEVAAGWSDPIDLLLLDADQSPAEARATYEAWLPFLERGGTIVLLNSGDREYAEGHDGYRRLAVDEILEPRYRDIRHVRHTTIAIKDF
jgi:MMP 1-O-methyltransferase